MFRGPDSEDAVRPGADTVIVAWMAGAVVAVSAAVGAAASHALAVAGTLGGVVVWGILVGRTLPAGPGRWRAAAFATAMLPAWLLQPTVWVVVPWVQGPLDGTYSLGPVGEHEALTALTDAWVRAGAASLLTLAALTTLAFVTVCVSPWRRVGGRDPEPIAAAESIYLQAAAASAVSLPTAPLVVREFGPMFLWDAPSVGWPWILGPLAAISFASSTGLLVHCSHALLSRAQRNLAAGWSEEDQLAGFFELTSAGLAGLALATVDLSSSWLPSWLWAGSAALGAGIAHSRPWALPRATAMGRARPIHFVATMCAYLGVIGTTLAWWMVVGLAWNALVFPWTEMSRAPGAVPSSAGSGLTMLVLAGVGLALPSLPVVAAWVRRGVGGAA